DLVAIKVGDRYLGGRDEPEVLDRVAIKVVAELRQVARPDQALAADHVRRVDLDVAVLARVEVEHQRDERPLQPRTPARQHVEARAGDLHAALEVDDVQRGPEIPVRLQREVVAALPSFLAHHDILALVLADRHRRVGQVWQLEQQRLQRRLGAGQLAVELFALLLQRGALGPSLLARLAGGRLSDRLRQPVLLGLQRLRFVLQIADARVGGDDRVQVDGGAEALIGGADFFGLFAQEAGVDHGPAVYPSAVAAGSGSDAV